MIDKETIAVLSEAMGDDFQDLVKTYIEDTDSILATLPSCVTSKNYSEVTRLAHSLKSSSASFGAMQVSALAKELEDNGASENLSSADQQISRLKEVFEPVRKELEQLTDL